MAITLLEMSNAIASARANGGYSHWFDGKVRNTGYVVGNGTKGLKFETANIEPAYLAATAQRWADKGAEGIGFWIDNGTLYVDPIFHYPIYDGQTAMAQALTWGEQAIYSLHDDRSIYTEQMTTYP